MGRTGRERVLMTKADLESEGIRISVRTLCDWLEVPRSSLYREPKQRHRYRLNEALVSEIRTIIDQKPHVGVRTIHWTLNRGRGSRVNIKAVHRIMKIKGWRMQKRPKGMRPRVEGWASRTSKPDVRWAVDMSVPQQVAREMRAGPSRSVCKNRPQITVSGFN